MAEEQFQMSDVYKTVDGYKVSRQQRSRNWDAAIGLQQVDGLNPSKYLLELSQDSIANEKSYDVILEELNTFYEKRDFCDRAVIDEYECDIVSTRMAHQLEDPSFSFSPIYFKDLHKKLFHDLKGREYYAGQFRNVNITKREEILQGRTVSYGDYSSLQDYLQYDFDIMAKHNSSFVAAPIEEVIAEIVRFTSNIWQAHPFREGNTRTTALFIQKYLRWQGYDINNELFKSNSKYFRNSLVLANYADMSLGIHFNTKYLTAFFSKLLVNTVEQLPEMEALQIKQKPRMADQLSDAQTKADEHNNSLAYREDRHDLERSR